MLVDNLTRGVINSGFFIHIMAIEKVCECLLVVNSSDKFKGRSFCGIFFSIQNQALTTISFYHLLNNPF
jgi:hypothetical protein